MKRVHNKVEKLLQAHPGLRSNDRLLLLAYWESEGLYLTPDQQSVFRDCTPAESITRARRALRADYPGNKAVELERFDKMVETQQEYSTIRFF